MFAFLNSAHVQTHSHRMDVSIRRLSLCHLYGCDAQGPDISYTVVADLLDHLWRHPKWCTDHSVSLCHGVLQGKTFIVMTHVLKFVYTDSKDHTDFSQKVKLRIWIHFVVSTNISYVTVSCPATPKSASLACPSVLRRMFPALMSRWIFLMKWRYSRPLSVDLRMVAISSSVN